MKYYIALPEPINNIVKDLEHDLGLVVEVTKENNQVGMLECDFTLEELEEELDPYGLIIINNNLEEWGI